jgi:hypothetical protein
MSVRKATAAVAAPAAWAEDVFADRNPIRVLVLGIAITSELDTEASALAAGLHGPGLRGDLVDQAMLASRLPITGPLMISRLSQSLY